MLNVSMQNVIMLNVCMQNVIMQNVIMLNVCMHNVIMLNAVVPFQRSFICLLFTKSNICATA